MREFEGIARPSINTFKGKQIDNEVEMSSVKVTREELFRRVWEKGRIERWHQTRKKPGDGADAAFDDIGIDLDAAVVDGLVAIPDTSIGRFTVG